MDELRDIKPLVPLSEPLPWWLWAVLGVVVLAAAFVVLRKWRKKPAAPVVLSETDAARLALSAIRGMRPRDQAAAERIQSHIALVLRRWIEAQHAVHATDMTTEELTAEPALRRALGDAGRDSAIALLTFADQVRFAGVSAPADEHTASIERAYALVVRP